MCMCICIVIVLFSYDMLPILLSVCLSCLDSHDDHIDTIITATHYMN